MVNNNSSETKRSFFQLIKFAIVGVLNTLVDFVVYTLLVLIFGVSEDNALIIGLFTLIAYGCGVLNSFIWNTKWTFKKEYKKTKQEAFLFIVVNLISWGLSYCLVLLFTNYVFKDSAITQWVCGLINFTSTEQISKAVSILSKLLATPIVIIVNFLGNKVFVFKK